MQYLERTYRRLASDSKLRSCQVTVRETDLLIRSDVDVRQPALDSVHRHRAHLETYISSHPDFLTALKPLAPDDLAPPIVRDMIKAARLTGVGPMAAVAGAVAQHVGEDLLPLTSNVMVENGGDIYLNSKEEIRVGVFAGTSPLSHRLAIRIRPEEMPVGVCTSSATVGPSLSFGVADAVCVTSRSAALADAAATAIGNLVRAKEDIREALSFGAQITGVLGILIIFGDELGVRGELELV